MQEQSRVRLAAALVTALGFVASGAANAATSEQASNQIVEKSPLVAVETAGSRYVQLETSDKTTKKDKKGQTKGKESSCKGKEGSCKGKEGSCKGKEGSCKGKEGTHKGSEEGGAMPGTGTGY